jgi:hypothetical protein
MDDEFTQVDRLISERNYNEVVRLLEGLILKIREVNEYAIRVKSLLDILLNIINPDNRGNRDLLHRVELLYIPLINLGVPFDEPSRVTVSDLDSFVLDVSNLYKPETSHLMRNLFLDELSPFSSIPGSVWGSQTDVVVIGPAAFSNELLRKRDVTGRLYPRTDRGQEHDAVDMSIAYCITKQGLIKPKSTLFVFSGDGNAELKVEPGVNNELSIFESVKTVIECNTKVVVVGAFKNSISGNYYNLARDHPNLTVIPFIEFYKDVMPSPPPPPPCDPLVPASQVVNEVINQMDWPKQMNDKFRSIPGPPCGSRLEKWDLEDALGWMDTDLGDPGQTMAAAKFMIEKLKPSLPRFPYRMTELQFVNAFVDHMKWSDDMKMKFRSIPGPPSGKRFRNWDFQDVLYWMADDLGNEVQTRAAAKYAIDVVKISSRLFDKFLYSLLCPSEAANYYAALNIAPNCTKDQVLHAFWRMSYKWKPENVHAHAQAQVLVPAGIANRDLVLNLIEKWLVQIYDRELNFLNHVRDVLTDEKRRCDYDQAMRGGGSTVNDYKKKYLKYKNKYIQLKLNIQH